MIPITATKEKNLWKYWTALDSNQYTEYDFKYTVHNTDLSAADRSLQDSSFSLLSWIDKESLINKGFNFSLRSLE